MALFCIIAHAKISHKPHPNTYWIYAKLGSVKGGPLLNENFVKEYRNNLLNHPLQNVFTQNVNDSVFSSELSCTTARSLCSTLASLTSRYIRNSSALFAMHNMLVCIENGRVSRVTSILNTSCCRILIAQLLWQYKVDSHMGSWAKLARLDDLEWVLLKGSIVFIYQKIITNRYFTWFTQFNISSFGHIATNHRKTHKKIINKPDAAWWSHV